MSRRIAWDTDPRKKNKKGPRPLETADDFMAAGVAEEDNGDRWKGSDDPKAGRFYAKAMEIYESALQRYPDNFDARYNLARLQYQITQLSLPPSFFPDNSSELKRLLAAAETHRQCLMSPGGTEIPDLLFNYGQVMASVAEAYTGPNGDGSSGGDAREALEQAVTLFKSCLSLQEREMVERETEIAAAGLAEAEGTEMQMDDADADREPGAARGGGVKLDPSAPDEPVEEQQDGDGERRGSVSSTSTAGQWALVTEAATEDSLLDTTLALLEVYTAYCALPPSQLSGLQQAETEALELMEKYLLPLASRAESTERKMEAMLTRAGFLVGLTEAAIKASNPRPEGWVTTWENNIKAAFEPYDFSQKAPAAAAATEQQEQGSFDFLTTSWRALCDRSTAYSAAASAAASSNEVAASWNLYSRAANDLAAAVKVSPDSRRSEIYLARGNLELERAMLSVRGSEAAEKNKETLRKNAGVYYKAAVNSGKSVIGASAASAQSKAAAEANIKASVVKMLQGESGALEELVRAERIPPETVKEVLVLGVEDGLWEGNIW